MTPSETAKILALASARDNRKVDDVMIGAWTEDLADVRFEDAREALSNHYRESRQWMMPVDIIAGVRAIREHRLNSSPRWSARAKFYQAMEAAGVPYYADGRTEAQAAADDAEQRKGPAPAHPWSGKAQTWDDIAPHRPYGDHASNTAIDAHRLAQQVYDEAIREGLAQGAAEAEAIRSGITYATKHTFTPAAIQARKGYRDAQSRKKRSVDDWMNRTAEDVTAAASEQRLQEAEAEDAKPKQIR